jgi:hypothetical protein
MEYVYDFTKQDVEAIHSFLSLAFYNGYEEDVADIRKVLYKAFSFDVDDKYKTVLRPEHWSKKINHKIDDFGGIFWSWLVLQYGDYGTSPRFGWIYAENSRRLYTIISGLLESEE